MVDPEIHCTFDNCGRSFKRKDRLEIHLRTHRKEKPFVCHVSGCSKSYTRSQHLKRHMNRVHLGLDLESRHICEECSKEICDWTAFCKHQQRFHSVDEETAYRCVEEGCSQMFCKKGQLLAHREKAHKQPPAESRRLHRCPVTDCGKSFPYPGVLRRHMKVHQGYPCDVEGCGQVLATSNQLRSHKFNAHPKDWQCPKCDMKFSTQSSLTQHKKIHGYKEPVVCPWEGCGRSYLYVRNMRQHIRAFHLGEPVFTKSKTKKSEMKPLPDSDQISHEEHASCTTVSTDTSALRVSDDKA